MNIYSTTSRLVALALCASLVACANPAKISPQNRAAIKQVQLTNPPKGVQGNAYLDNTSAGALAAGAQFGLVGALVGGSIAVANANAGVKRWKGITGGREGRVLQAFRDNLQREFARAGKFKFGVPADAELAITGLTYGVAHAGKQKFNVVVQGGLQMKRGGKAVWTKFDTGTSSAPLSQEEFQANPKAFGAALEEAVQSLSQKLAGAY